MNSVSFSRNCFILTIYAHMYIYIYTCICVHKYICILIYIYAYLNTCGENEEYRPATQYSRPDPGDHTRAWLGLWRLYCGVKTVFRMRIIPFL